MKIAYYRKKADTAFQEYGRKHFFKCEVCGGSMDCLHHFFPKSISSALRYNLDNAIPICTSCHYQHHTKSDPRIHGTIIKRRGIDWYNNLLEGKYKEVKPSKKYYEEIIKRFSQ